MEPDEVLTKPTRNITHDTRVSSPSDSAETDPLRVVAFGHDTQSGYSLLHQIPDYLGGTRNPVDRIYFWFIDSSVTATPELHTRSQLSVVFPLVVIFRL